MNQLDTIHRLAETDPYWRGYVEGLADKRQIATKEPTHEAHSAD